MGIPLYHLRIIAKIEHRRNFTLQSWDRRDIIFAALENAGFRKLWDFETRTSHCIGWEYYFFNHQSLMARVTICQIPGKHIEVQFCYPNY
ncbi:MAG: hypothetical protein OEV66_01780 [Spirochaetia bacterium]|nr:hypothetical protein [Spirochaetia bacterium]